MSTLKPALPRTESELGRNRAQKGDKSYYYAHGEKWEVPPDAVVRAGPGLVTGGAPVRLNEDGEPELPPPTRASNDDVRDEVIAQLRARIDGLERELVQARAGTKPLTQFSFSDEGAKCKVYVDVGSDLLEHKEESEESSMILEAGVVVTFSARNALVRVVGVRPDGTIGERRAVTLVCESEVVPSKCAYKVDRTKGRVTLSLKKRDETKKWANVSVLPQ